MSDTQVPLESSTGLPPHIAAGLCYVLGLVSGVAFLWLERQSRFVRFHALQSTLTSIVVIVALEGARFAPLPIADGFLHLAVLVLFVFLIVQALRGEFYELPGIGTLAREREDPVEP